MPICPLRIGLITSQDSDAYSDFIHELQSSGFSFELLFHSAKMQGVDASTSLSKAIRRFDKKNIDVLAVVRGGGAKSSLADLDSIEVGRAVCESDIKVICGIGHHRDHGVLDEVCEGTKTPTAAAQVLVQQVASYLQKVNRISAKIAYFSEKQIVYEQQKLEGLGQHLSARVFKHTRETERNLNRLAGAIPAAWTYYLRRYEADNKRMFDDLAHLADRHQRRQANRLNILERRIQKLPLARQLQRGTGKVKLLEYLLSKRSNEKLGSFTIAVKHLEKQLEWMKPGRTLARGYAIVRKEGRIIKSIKDVEIGDTLTSTFRDGRLVVSVQEIEKREK